MRLLEVTWLDAIKVLLELIALLATLGLFRWADRKYVHFRKNRDTWRVLISAQLKNIEDMQDSMKKQLYPNRCV